MKVLITGGHVTPALAVIDELKNCEVVFVGREYALSSDNSKSFEFNEIRKKGIRFIDLPAGRLTRILSFKTLLNILKIPAGFIKAAAVLRKERPDVILTFGGYIALPMSIMAFIRKVPIITHEQTIHPGSANRLIGLLARKVFVSFSESKQFFPDKKVVQSGNPIRREIFEVIVSISDFKSDKPVLFVTGGSIGSHDLNSLVFRILPELLKKYVVIHQTGDATEFADFEKSKKITDPKYFPYKHIESDLLGFVFKKSDLVLSRSGANTVFELLAMRKPSVLVPLPWSAFGEQQKHAEYMKRLGTAEIFEQTKSSEELLKLINSMFGLLEKYRKNFDTIKLPYDPKNSAKQIAKEVLAIGQKTSHAEYFSGGSYP